MKNVPNTLCFFFDRQIEINDPSKGHQKIERFCFSLSEIVEKSIAYDCIKPSGQVDLLKSS